MMKTWITGAVAALAIVGLAGCGSDETSSDAATFEEAAATSATELPMAATAQCIEFCERVDRLVDEQCESDGPTCSDMLTAKAMLAMKIRDSDVVNAPTRSSAQNVVDKGGEFGTERCYDEVHMSSTCATLADDVETLYTELHTQIHTDD